MHQTSPGVERAVEAARAWAKRLGSPHLRLPDLLLGLLEEEEGHPASLAERLGLALADLRQTFATVPLGLFPPAPPLDQLFQAARDWSIAHRADPGFMTDALLVAVLRADPSFGQFAARSGLDADRLAPLLVRGESPFADPGDPAVSFDLTGSSGDTDVARVLDVNLNRSREALRVLEDYCRFVLNDRLPTGQVKELRHGLAAAAVGIPDRLLLASRDTLQDVGTSISAPGEYERQSPAQVAQVNLKRLQESLRSLEEYGKVLGPETGRQVEALRYRVYTLERAIGLGSHARAKLAASRLYLLLTGSQCAASLDWVIEQAAAGGADVVQLREKVLPDRELVERAREVRRWTRAANLLFIVNDRPDVARLVDADGVHLGQDDLSVRDARRILGPAAIIGVSTHTLEQVRHAVLDGADYIGVGPTFPSTTKEFAVFPGLDFVRSAAAETSLPAFALGGIGPDNVGQVVAAGLRRVAVSAAIARADAPQQVARILRTALDPGK
jgi:thiamine-phosphate pyrophosphorylase